MKNDFIHKLATIQMNLTKDEFEAFVKELKNAGSKEEYMKILNDKYEWAIK